MHSNNEPPENVYMEVLSRVELIFPHNVVETCYNIDKDDEARFQALNFEEGKASDVVIKKLEDNSVRIRVTVVAFGVDQEEDESFTESLEWSTHHKNEPENICVDLQSRVQCKKETTHPDPTNSVQVDDIALDTNNVNEDNSHQECNSSDTANLDQGCPLTNIDGAQEISSGKSEHILENSPMIHISPNPNQICSNLDSSDNGHQMNKISLEDTNSGSVKAEPPSPEKNNTQILTHSVIGCETDDRNNNKSDEMIIEVPHTSAMPSISDSMDQSNTTQRNSNPENTVITPRDDTVAASNPGTPNSVASNNSTVVRKKSVADRMASVWGTKKRKRRKVSHLQQDNEKSQGLNHAPVSQLASKAMNSHVKQKTMVVWKQKKCLTNLHASSKEAKEISKEINVGSSTKRNGSDRLAKIWSTTKRRRKPKSKPVRSVSKVLNKQKVGDDVNDKAKGSEGGTSLAEETHTMDSDNDWNNTGSAKKQQKADKAKVKAVSGKNQQKKPPTMALKKVSIPAQALDQAEGTNKNKAIPEIDVKSNSQQNGDSESLKQLNVRNEIECIRSHYCPHSSRGTDGQLKKLSPVKPRQSNTDVFAKIWTYKKRKSKGKKVLNSILNKQTKGLQKKMQGTSNEGKGSTSDESPTSQGLPAKRISNADRMAKIWCGSKRRRKIKRKKDTITPAAKKTKATRTDSPSSSSIEGGTARNSVKNISEITNKKLCSRTGKDPKNHKNKSKEIKSNGVLRGSTDLSKFRAMKTQLLGRIYHAQKGGGTGLKNTYMASLEAQHKVTTERVNARGYSQDFSNREGPLSSGSVSAQHSESNANQVKDGDKFYLYNPKMFTSVGNTNGRLIKETASEPSILYNILSKKIEEYVQDPNYSKANKNDKKNNFGYEKALHKQTNYLQPGEHLKTNLQVAPVQRLPNNSDAVNHPMPRSDDPSSPRKQTSGTSPNAGAENNAGNNHETNKPRGTALGETSATDTSEEKDGLPKLLPEDVDRLFSESLQEGTSSIPKDEEDDEMMFQDPKQNEDNDPLGKLRTFNLPSHHGSTAGVGHYQRKEVHLRLSDLTPDHGGSNKQPSSSPPCQSLTPAKTSTNPDMTTLSSAAGMEQRKFSAIRDILESASGSSSSQTGSSFDMHQQQHSNLQVSQVKVESPPPSQQPSLFSPSWDEESLGQGSTRNPAFDPHQKESLYAHIWDSADVSQGTSPMPSASNQQRPLFYPCWGSSSSAQGGEAIVHQGNLANPSEHQSFTSPSWENTGKADQTKVWQDRHTEATHQRFPSTQQWSSPNPHQGSSGNLSQAQDQLSGFPKSWDNDSATVHGSFSPRSDMGHQSPMRLPQPNISSPSWNMEAISPCGTFSPRGGRSEDPSSAPRRQQHFYPPWDNNPNGSNPGRIDSQVPSTDNPQMHPASKWENVRNSARLDSSPSPRHFFPTSDQAQFSPMGRMESPDTSQQYQQSFTPDSRRFSFQGSMESIPNPRQQRTAGWDNSGCATGRQVERTAGTPRYQRTLSTPANISSFPCHRDGDNRIPMPVPPQSSTSWDGGKPPPRRAVLEGPAPIQCHRSMSWGSAASNQPNLQRSLSTSSWESLSSTGNFQTLDTFSGPQSQPKSEDPIPDKNEMEEIQSPGLGDFQPHSIIHSSLSLLNETDDDTKDQYGDMDDSSATQTSPSTSSTATEGPGQATGSSDCVQYTEPKDVKPRHSNYQCKLCTAKVKDYAYLYRHVKRHHSSEDDNYKQYLDELWHLMRTPCTICKKKICSTNMGSHMAQCHGTNAVITCSLCEKACKTKLELKQHLRQSHSHKYACPHCSQAFGEKKALHDHLQTAHPNVSMWKCDFCSKTFQSKGNLSRHRRTHGEFRFFCSYCDKGFHQKENMKKHVQMIHEKIVQLSFDCTYCQKSFTTKGNLQQHVKNIHIHFPYTCSKCKGGFHKKIDLITHMQSHSATGESAKNSDSQDDKASLDLDQDTFSFTDDTMESHPGEKESDDQHKSSLEMVEDSYDCPMMESLHAGGSSSLVDESNVGNHETTCKVEENVVHEKSLTFTML